MRERWISSVSGVPIARDFETTRAMGSPLVIDTATRRAYYILPNGTVTQLYDIDTPFAALASVYRTIFQASASHTAAKVAGTYGLGEGDPAAVSGTGTLYPLAIFYIDDADFPAVGGLVAKLRVRATLHCNDVAPTGNFTFGLYPVTRPASSGGAGLCVYTIGTLVPGSAAPIITAPAADSSNTVVGSDFAIPADGYYILAFVSTATVAASAHLHMDAFLQQHHA